MCLSVSARWMTDRVYCSADDAITASLPWTSSTTASSPGRPPVHRWVRTCQPASRKGCSRGSSGPVTPAAVTRTEGMRRRVSAAASAGVAPERCTLALQVQDGRIERRQLVAQRLRRAGCEADRQLDGRQRVVAAVRVLHQRREELRPLLFNGLQHADLALGIQTLELAPSLALRADRNLEEPVQEHSPQPR